jgi:hypothetical protein
MQDQIKDITMNIQVEKFKGFFKILLKFDFSGAYQPYNRLPYGYSYYTTRNPIFGF